MNMSANPMSASSSACAACTTEKKCEKIRARAVTTTKRAANAKSLRKESWARSVPFCSSCDSRHLCT